MNARQLLLPGGCWNGEDTECRVEEEANGPIRSRRLELGVIGGHSVEGESRAVNWGTEPEAFTLRVGRETTS